LADFVEQVAYGEIFYVFFADTAVRQVVLFKSLNRLRDLPLTFSVKRCVIGPELLRTSSGHRCCSRPCEYRWPALQVLWLDTMMPGREDLFRFQGENTG